MDLQESNNSLVNRRKTPFWKIACYACAAVVFIVTAGIFVLLLYPNTFLNGYLKHRLELALQEACTQHTAQIAVVNFSFWDNVLEIDSVKLIPKDTSFAVEVASISIRKIDWLSVMWSGEFHTRSLGNTVATAHNVSLTSDRYKFMCKGLGVSFPDSTFDVHQISIAPKSDDEEFFDQRKTRSTRFIINAHQLTTSGFDVLGAIERRQFTARLMLVDSLSIDIYVNKEKDFDRKAEKPRMPNEILALVPGKLNVDSITITNSQFRLAERFVKGDQPATVAVDEIGMHIAGITNVPDSSKAMELNVHGRMQKSGRIKAHISLPTNSVGLAMRINGSLSAMPLSKFNSFLQIADHTKITSGQLHSASMNISILNGRSTGNIKAVYTDLYIEMLDEKTNKATGLLNSIKTFISNLFVFRSSNTRDSDGKIDLGTVNYVQKPSDEVMEIVWFSVRSGIGDVIGF